MRSNKKGQSLVELLIAIGITAILAGSAVGALLLSVRINKESNNFRTASSLAQELMDEMRSYSEGDWNNLYGLPNKGPSSTYIIFNEDTISPPDPISNAGKFSSLDLDTNGFPVIAYLDEDLDSLKVMHCNDKGCLGAAQGGVDEDVFVVDPGGYYNSLKLDSSGHPVIAHYDPGPNEFRVVHCNDPNCDPNAPGGSGAESIETIKTRVAGLSLALDTSNFPVVSYRTDQGHNVEVLHCTDTNCQGTKNINALFTTGSAGEEYTSLALSPSTGFPVVAYNDNGNLGVIRCDDINCVPTETRVSVDGDPNNVRHVSLALDSNEYPVVSYYDAAPNYDLKVTRCYNKDCTSGNESIVIADSVGDTGESTSLQLDELGNPIISYIGNDWLKIMHCNDPNCDGGDESVFQVDKADPNANVFGTSMALDTSFTPAVSYYEDDPAFNLKVLRCDDPNCDFETFTVLNIASGTEDVNLNSTTFTRWFSVEDVERDSNGDGDIVTSGGDEDPSTQKITVHVEWQESGDTASITLVEYFTRWFRNTSAIFTDWSGSSGVEGPITVTDSNFSSESGDIDVSTKGQIQLSQ